MALYFVALIDYLPVAFTTDGCTQFSERMNWMACGMLNEMNEI